MAEKRQTVELFENQCAVCYRVFVQRRGGRLRRTCSAACRQKLYRMRHRKQVDEDQEKAGNEQPPEKEKRVFPRVETTCPVCGAALVQPWTGRKRKTCSESCRKRLWRQQNPRCLVCGKTFTPSRFQKEQKYCSAKCRGRAREALRRQRELARRREELGNYRPEWLPRPGSGYREEVVPWEGDEQEAVIRERKPEAIYRETPEEEEARRKAEEERLEAEWKAQAKAYREERRRLREAERMGYDLLVDESKWWDW
jgi:ribosomal protein S27E